MKTLNDSLFCLTEITKRHFVEEGIISEGYRAYNPKVVGLDPTLATKVVYREHHCSPLLFTAKTGVLMPGRL